MPKSNIAKKQLFLLSAVSILAVLLFIFYHLPKRYEYALYHRSLTVVAIIVTGSAIALATMLFQAIVNNRILTPSILGLDSLYLLLQTLILFCFGSTTLNAINPILLFFISTGCMVLFAVGLFKLLFSRENQNLFFLLLVGIILGTFFQSLTTFMEVLIDPNEFQIAQDIGFASFNRINLDILWIALGILILTIFYSLRYFRYFDVLALGKEQAINLGVDYQRLTRKFLIIVAILTSVSTALVGPMTFLGLLVMNVTFEFIKTYKHHILIPASMLISTITLILGQWLVTQVFSFNTTLSIIVNFVGGVYFIYLLLRTQQKW